MFKLPRLLLAFAISGLLGTASADTECSATVACEIGCCGTWGVCGMGPDYCGADNCINNCDAKADCDPDNWGSNYYGFCGTTEEFCGNDTVTRPSCDVDLQSITRVIGYYGSGALTRLCDGMLPLSIPQGVYSHIYFAFASIDPDTFEAVPAVESDLETLTKLQALQYRELGIELWLSIGGWDFSDDDFATATTWSDLAAADITYQNVFFSSLALLLMSYGFTGVDIDWEYPAADDRNGRDEDYANFPVFLANLKSAMSSYGFGISVTLPTSYWYLKHFDLAAIEPSVDWFNYMSYDLHGAWDIGNEWTGAYLDSHTNLTEIEDALDLIWRNDIPSNKITLGLAFYGRSFTVASTSCVEPGCDYLSAGDAGDCSAQAGILLNSEIQTIMSENDLTPTFYSDAAVKVLTWDNQWVSYDDEDTFKLKGDFAKSQCLGGVLVWAVDYDDNNGTFSYGLAAALGNELNVDTETGVTLTIAETSSGSSSDPLDSMCRWMNCGESCPSGFSQIIRDDKKSQIMLDSSYCFDDEMQVLCCPTSTELPTCRWRGFHNSGQCQNGCSDGEVEVGSTMAGCSWGYQSACCTTTESTSSYSGCKWYSDAPDCTDGTSDSCPSDYPTFVAKSRNGWGGMRRCDEGRYHVYCCQAETVPEPFTNCDWYGHEDPDVQDLSERICSNACPSDTMRFATQFVGAYAPSETEDCAWGAEAYCCAGSTDDTTSDVDPRDVAIIYQDETAELFDAYLEQWLNNPICPGEWAAQYSDTDPVTVTKRDSLLQLLRERATDQTSTLEVLLPMMYALFAAKYTRTDIEEIWDTRISAYLGDEAADFGLIYDVMYPDGYTASPVDDTEWFLADMMCDLEDSAYGLESYAGATAVCINSDDASSIVSKRSISEEVRFDTTANSTYAGLWRRRLAANSMNLRASQNTVPTVSAAMNGAIAGDLSIHYLRWLHTAGTTSGTEVELEVAFWIGGTPGTAPSTVIQTAYSDTTHTIQRDRWIVAHFHIPLDSQTFINYNGQVYLGINYGRVYHSQEIRRPGRVSAGVTPDYRAEYRRTNNYGGTTNSVMTNYNARSSILNCPTATSRWYPGSGLSSGDAPATNGI
ncbi:hypothetical protein TruAng_011415 [Truncatella angustata]|nr:hypothetical protein TruAng_011415 [Truncatella angustata]